ncbi:MAG: hypothetical protein CMP22_06690 [Rickettsiales bacterium]|nr:hypothetical protein [Rickettsiales bacterium]|tara:strand:+ start:747 stop:1202 length:456 start_codon:yes stop_codon:yes gene_type:complete
MTLNKKQIATYSMSAFICFVFIQSLFFKFTDAPETQHIFGILNAWAFEEFGFKDLFIGSGIFSAKVIGTFELITSIILILGLITKFKVATPIGGLMAIGVMSGAIFFHLFTPLGIEVQGDGGTLFFMACLIWVFSLVLIILHKDLILKFLK